MAKDFLSQGWNCEFRRPGCGRTCYRKVALRRSESHRDLGLEWWWFGDAECDVSLPGGLCDRHGCGARCRPSLLRHDLPGAIGWTTQGSSGGVETEFADHVCAPVERQFADRSRNRRR